MAKITETYMIDDLTGERADDATTVTFGLDGKTYEIDLSAANAADLRDLMVEYIAKGRVVQASRTTRKQGTKPAGTGRDNKAIRAWCAEHGIQVSDRGRIPDGILRAYDRQDPTLTETPPVEQIKPSLKVVEPPAAQHQAAPVPAAVFKDGQSKKPQRKTS